MAAAPPLPPPRYRQAIRVTQGRLDQVVAASGTAKVRALFATVESDLQKALARIPAGSFGEAQRKSALVQIRTSLLRLSKSMEVQVTEASVQAQLAAVQALAGELAALERQFSGAVVPVPLLEAARFKGVAGNVATSLLVQHRASMARYGAGVITSMEDVMARGILGGAQNTEMVDKMMATFEGHRWQAERIVRTELAWSYNAGHVNAAVAQAQAMPDLMMRWSEHVEDETYAPLDDRVAEDSIAMHGQLAPPGGLFTQPPTTPDGEEVPEGLVAKTWPHPPNRPNDRAVIAPWRPGWGIPGWVWKDGRRQPYTGGRVPEVTTRDKEEAATPGLPAPDPTPPAEPAAPESPGVMRPPATVDMMAHPPMVKASDAALAGMALPGIGDVGAVAAAQGLPDGSGLHQRVNATRVVKDGVVSVMGNVMDGKNIAAKWERQIIRKPNGSVVVENKLLEVAQEYRGRGISDAMNGAAFAAYKAAGVKQVELDAGLEIGRYQWMRLGFKATPAAQKKIVAQFERWASGYKELKHHAPALAAQVAAMLKHPGGIAGLAVDGVEITPPGMKTKVPVGKAFLLTPEDQGGCPMYRATLPLKDGDPFWEHAAKRLGIATAAPAETKPAKGRSRKKAEPVAAEPDPAPTPAPVPPEPDPTPAPSATTQVADLAKQVRGSVPSGLSGPRYGRAIYDAELARPEPRPLGQVLSAANGIGDPSISSEMGAVLRGGVNRFMAKFGLKPYRGTVQIDTDSEGGGTMHWDGRLSLHPILRDRLAAMGAKLEAGRPDEVDVYEVDAVRTLIHEQLHSMSNQTPNAYAGAGALVEEVSTEVMARRLTREFLKDNGLQAAADKHPFLGRPLHDTEEAGGAYAGDIRTVVTRVAAATGLDEDAAYGAIERASMLQRRGGALATSPDAVVQQFADQIATAIRRPELAAAIARDLNGAPSAVPKAPASRRVIDQEPDEPSRPAAPRSPTITTAPRPTPIEAAATLEWSLTERMRHDLANELEWDRRAVGKTPMTGGPAHVATPEAELRKKVMERHHQKRLQVTDITRQLRAGRLRMPTASELGMADETEYVAHVSAVAPAVAKLKPRLARQREIHSKLRELDALRLEAIRELGGAAAGEFSDEKTRKAHLAKVNKERKARHLPLLPADGVDDDYDLQESQFQIEVYGWEKAEQRLTTMAAQVDAIATKRMTLPRDSIGQAIAPKVQDYDQPVTAPAIATALGKPRAVTGDFPDAAYRKYQQRLAELIPEVESLRGDQEDVRDKAAAALERLGEGALDEDESETPEDDEEDDEAFEDEMEAVATGNGPRHRLIVKEIKLDETTPQQDRFDYHDMVNIADALEQAESNRIRELFRAFGSSEAGESYPMMDGDPAEAVDEAIDDTDILLAKLRKAAGIKAKGRAKKKTDDDEDE